MGKGRRMKKQGPPAALDNAKFDSLKKRKAGDDTKEAGKKRRRAEADEDVLKETPKKKLNGVASEEEYAKKGKANGVAPKEEKTKEPQFMESDDEENDEEASNLEDDEEMMDDEFGDLDGVSDEGSDEDEDDKDVVDSDEEDHPRETMFSDDEDEDDAEEKLTAANMEGLSRKLDAAREVEEEEADAELQEAAMQTNIAGDRPDVFGGEDGQEALAPDLQLLRTRITDTIRILGDVKTLGQPDKSRADYVQLLLNDICVYYGYTYFLAEKLFNLFTPMEAFAFFEANETPRPVVLRTNSLRTNRRSLAQALINRGVVLEPVGKWSKVGLQVFESAVPLGATPEYLAGHYILQAASSFLPVMALAPQPNERVLDMASAPGGKTTYIAALMRNTGSIIANDASKPRAKGLIGNIHRLGCKNTIVTNLDARDAFPKAVGGFDRVLLDAPCTGTGVISKDASVKTSKNERDFLAIPHMQRQLLLAAVDSVDHASKTGGYIVYSTCSVTVDENEAVVQYILRKRPNVKIVDTGLADFGSPGFTKYMGKQFDPKMSLTRRYFPHRENVDGFFVCKLRKIGPYRSTIVTTANGAPAIDATAAPTKTPSLTSDTSSSETIDRTPITDEEGHAPTLEGGAFGPFDDDNEDAERIERAERNRLRRKGLNPKGVLDKPKKNRVTPKVSPESKAEASEKEGKAKVEVEAKSDGVSESKAESGSGEKAKAKKKQQGKKVTSSK